MEFRKFGRTEFKVSEIGYGMWGLAGWEGSEEKEYNQALDLSVEMGCNFFDTAWGYAEGLSERVLGKLLERHPNKRLYAATKIPPKNFQWPSKSHYSLEDCFPYSHIIEYTEKSLKNLKTDCIDLQQFHVWEDAWAGQDDWQNAVEKLKKDGKVKHFGVSVNRWEPENCSKTLGTGYIDAVQVIYNIFDQAPEDRLFSICQELDIAVIARVPFDEGTLTGKLTKDTTFPENDWRNTYFVPENLKASVEHANELKPLIPQGMDMPEMALRFILQHPAVSTTIPGMRKMNHVKGNMSVSDGKDLDQELLKELHNHRWDRTPTAWSQ